MIKYIFYGQKTKAIKNSQKKIETWSICHSSNIKQIKMWWNFKQEEEYEEEKDLDTRGILL